MCNISTIKNIISEIQMEIFEQTDREDFNLTVMSDGYVIIVNLFGIRIWDSESDEREYLGKEDGTEDDKREPIEDHLLRVIKETLEQINSIKL